MYVPRVLSPKVLMPLDISQSLSSCYSFASCQSSGPTITHPTTSNRGYNLGEQSQSPIQQYGLKTSISDHFSSKTRSKSSKSNNIPIYKDSRLNRLLQQLNALQQNSKRFNNSLTTVCSQLQHQIQSNSLKHQMLGNQIIELRIDLKQRQEDIGLLKDMIESNQKLSSIADKSTDTEGSSSAKSSYSENQKLSTNKMNSGHNVKRISPKTGVRIFNKV